MGPKAKRAQWTPEQLKEAIQLVRQGGKSLREAMRTTGVDKETISRYLKKQVIEISAGSPSRKRPRDLSTDFSSPFSPPIKKCALGRPTVLDEAEEAVLEARILYCGKRNMHLKRRFLLREANELLRERNGHGLRSTIQLGESWIRGFPHRHPSVSLRTPEMLDPSRAKVTNVDVAKEHFATLEAVLYEKHLVGQSHRIWNVDETGLTLGKASGCKVLAARGLGEYGRRPQPPTPDTYL